MARNTTEKGESRSFWQAISLDELAEEQGREVVFDLDSAGTLWPADDDPDALFDFIVHERHERRRVAANGIA